MTDDVKMLAITLHNVSSVRGAKWGVSKDNSDKLAITLQVECDVAPEDMTTLGQIFVLRGLQVDIKARQLAMKLDKKKPDPVVTNVGQKIADIIGPDSHPRMDLKCLSCGATMIYDGERPDDATPDAWLHWYHCIDCPEVMTFPSTAPKSTEEPCASGWSRPKNTPVLHYFPSGKDSLCGHFLAHEVAETDQEPHGDQICNLCAAARAVEVDAAKEAEQTATEEAPAAPATPLTQGWAKGMHSWHYYGEDRRSLCKDYMLGNLDDLHEYATLSERCKKCEKAWEKLGTVGTVDNEQTGEAEAVAG